MIEGEVDALGVPRIPVTIGSRRWPAVIDTGFNGDLELPKSLFPDLNPRYLGMAHALLAGGHTVEEEQFLVDLEFDSIERRAVATFAETQTVLIGTNLLRDSVLEIDFRAGTVLVSGEPLA